MQALLDFLDNFVFGPLNWIDRLEGLFKATYYRDAGYQFAMLRMEKGGKHSRREVEDMLARYGIAVFGRTYDAKRHYFLVKKRQARWAEYLMLHAGVELHGPLFDERNARYVAQHPVGWMPPAWSAQAEDRHDPLESTDTDIQAEINSSQPNDAWRVLKKIIEWD